MYPTNLIKVNLKQSAVISSDLFATGTCRFSWNDTVPYFMYGTLTLFSVNKMCVRQLT